MDIDEAQKIWDKINDTVRSGEVWKCADGTAYLAIRDGMHGRKFDMRKIIPAVQSVVGNNYDVEIDADGYIVIR